MIYVLIDLSSIVKIVTLQSFFLSALLSIGMLLSNRKNTKNQIFFGLFLAFSLIIFYFFLFESNLVETHPYLSVVCLPGLYLIGPMVYFLALYSINKTFQFSKHHFWHIVPGFLSLIFGIAGIYIFGFEHLSVYFDFFGNKAILLLGFLGVISFITYLIITGKKLFNSYLWNLHTLKKEPSALASFMLFDFFVFASITDTLSLFTGNYMFLQLSMLLISICVISLFILNLIFPNFNIVISNVVINEKQRRSHLSNIDTDNLKAKLDELIRTKEIYTDEHLTLKKLSSMTGVSSHQLSEFINTRYNKSYTLFINEFRVNKAKKLLFEKTDYTILAIAYEVGFNSKSAFNEAFRKITGLTPSQFKSNHQNKTLS